MTVTENGMSDVGVQGQDDPTVSADVNASQDFVGGIMKIVPSEVDVSRHSTFMSAFLLFKRKNM